MEDAQDATQGFFTHFFELDAMASVDRSRGRFRNYLLAILEHYLANEHRKAGDLKTFARAALSLETVESLERELRDLLRLLQGKDA